MTKPKNYLALKWGTLKAWNFTGIPEAQELLERYSHLGRSGSSMAQRDNPEQKELICKLIDLMPGAIYLDWDDRLLTKDAAKKYVLEYGQS